MSLTTIPSEIVLLIAEKLPPKDLKRLVETNRYHASLLTPLMHGHAMADKSGLTALQWAAKHGHERLALFLLGKGADIDEVKKGVGMTTLHYAALGGRLEMVKMLLRNGADVDRGEGVGGVFSGVEGRWNPGRGTYRWTVGVALNCINRERGMVIGLGMSSCGWNAGW